jgi:MoxR-like ATPase
MNDSSEYLIYHEGAIARTGHDETKARQRLATSAGTAAYRTMEAGAKHFLPTRDLVNAINAAIASCSPLLLTGEPGVGKTQVAYYVSHYFGIKIFHYQVRSDSCARDLRYDFNAVAYLRDAYLASMRPDRTGVRGAWHPPLPDRASSRYLKKGDLWLAYEQADGCVLLIDEIDKAPRDFPNDLLREMADYCFDHPFISGRKIKHGEGPAPIVVITSNNERQLPDAFLRRCIVHNIKFDPTLLTRILEEWTDDIASGLPYNVREKAQERFEELRDKLEGIGRPPGTAEFLIWLSVLNAFRVNIERLEVARLDDLPHVGCLIKDQEDYEHIK